MPIAQPGIFAQGTRSHFFLEFDIRSGVSAEAALEALQGLRQPAVTAGGANIVIAFGPDRWRSIRPDDAPAELRAFPSVDGTANTQHDVLVWIHGSGPDVLLDIARAVNGALAPVADVATEIPAFVYQDSRDLTGFIDGTENPGVEEAFDVALVPDGPGAGGSFVITQKWRHDLAKFHALSVEEQEAVFGRTKPDSQELDDDVKPPTAHIARTVIEEDGEELEIYRRSVPYGTVTEHGLFFLAFSADPSRFEKMLSRMFGTSGDSLKDRLIEFSTPLSGSFYFAPSLQSLEDALG
ncbi:MAG: Dyp-type peroxidase [Acidimicrobiia bacterium]